jgi:hypothetical protein
MRSSLPRRPRLPRRLAPLLAPPAALALLLAGLPGLSQSLASPSATHPAGKAAPAAASLALSVATRPGHPAELLLASRLRGGSHTSGGSVAFFVVSREFKSPAEVPIGTAKMAADGVARLIYRPTWSGRQELLAKLALPGAHVPAASAYYSVTTSTPGPLFAAANPTRRFSSTGSIFMNVIRTLVALIWLSLIVILVMVRARMPRLAREGTD